MRAACTHESSTGCDCNIVHAGGLARCKIANSSTRSLSPVLVLKLLACCRVPLLQAPALMSRERLAGAAAAARDAGCAGGGGGVHSAGRRFFLARHSATAESAGSRDSAARAFSSGRAPASTICLLAPASAQPCSSDSASSLALREGGWARSASSAAMISRL
eukprot:6180143-Pleurochrysis_carterae.AAC.6